MSSGFAELCADQLSHVTDLSVSGRVTAVKGLIAECSGIVPFLRIGTRCRIEPGMGRDAVMAEVVGFNEGSALLMPFRSLEGVGPGAAVYLEREEAAVYPCDAWQGRILNAFGEPMDEAGPLALGKQPYAFKGQPPAAAKRNRVAGKLDLGIKALNTFTTCCNGQRMGIFAGSGVGKSILMSMLARYAKADVNVIGLIGERGREVQEFIQDDLGEEGLKRSVLIVATSSESALMRRQAAYLTLSVAEYFRDQGKQVLCLMDSVTRFAMAQREIGLSAGEPPTTKGYTPTVFAELPHLLERAGPGTGAQGNITGLFTVLVEGDDENEPVSDATRGILDGHILLNRKIAQRGRYPSIDILKSVSRMLPDCNDEAENQLITIARSLMTTYEDMAEMIRLGAYRRGGDKEVDQAIELYPRIEDFLRQRIGESCTLDESYDQLAVALGITNWRKVLGGEGA
jgi:flagellum-specific ATP synthase